MGFFNSLPLDLKLLLIGIAGCVLLALFSTNAKTEKRYTFVLVLLTAAGVYRFTRPAHEDIEARATAVPVSHVVTAPAKHVPLVSTTAK
jgi:hypothetical protein